jgi:hypothetical protein
MTTHGCVLDSMVSGRRITSVAGSDGAEMGAHKRHHLSLIPFLRPCIGTRSGEDDSATGPPYTQVNL